MGNPVNTILDASLADGWVSFDPSLPPPLLLNLQEADDSNVIQRTVVLTAQITQSDITDLLNETVEQRFRIATCRNTGLIVSNQIYTLGQGPKTFTVSQVSLDTSSDYHGLGPLPFTYTAVRLDGSPLPAALITFDPTLIQFTINTSDASEAPEQQFKIQATSDDLSWSDSQTFEAVFKIVIWQKDSVSFKGEDKVYVLNDEVVQFTLTPPQIIPSYITVTCTYTIISALPSYMSFDATDPSILKFKIDP